jgi:hypothetical protein
MLINRYFRELIDLFLTFSINLKLNQMKLTRFFILAFFALNLQGQERQIPIDTLIVTNHSVTIKDVKVNYSAETGTQPVWNEHGKPIASLFYTYYSRTNGAKPVNRPIIFSFNGGPGSASVWMHVAYTGPKILKIDDEGYPVQPYGFETNPYSVLDVADIVFINPVNTAYSRIIEYDGEKEKRETFFGVNEDIKYLASRVPKRWCYWKSKRYTCLEKIQKLHVEDIVEELFGEIEDEHDLVDHYELKINENEYEFSARLEVDYLNTTYDLSLPEEEFYETLGGLVVHFTEEIPLQGDVFSLEQYEFKILAVSSTKIERIHLSVKEP